MHNSRDQTSPGATSLLRHGCPAFTSGCILHAGLNSLSLLTTVAPINRLRGFSIRGIVSRWTRACFHGGGHVRDPRAGPTILVATPDSLSCLDNCTPGGLRRLHNSGDQVGPSATPPGQVAQLLLLVRGERLPTPLSHLGGETRHQQGGNQLAKARTAEDRQAIQQQQGSQSRQQQGPQRITGTGEFREGGGQQQQGQGQDQNPVTQAEGQPGEGQGNIQPMVHCVLPRFRHFRHHKGGNPPKIMFRVSGMHRLP